MAVRTVSVALKMLVSDYIVGAKTAIASTKQVAGEAEKVGHKFDEAAVSGAFLAKELEAVRLKSAALSRQFDETGDKSLVKQIAANERYMAQLKRMGKSLEDVGEEAAKEGEALGKSLGKDTSKGFGNAFGNALDDVLPKVLSNPETLAVAAAAAPELGIVIGAAVLTGIGLAGIGAGIALSLRDPGVKQALTDFKGEVSATFADAGAPFVGPVERSLKSLGDFISADLGPGIKTTLAALAPEVAGLEKGVEGFVAPLVSGLERAAIASKPLIDEFSKQDLPAIGNAIGGVFNTIADNAPAAEKGLQDLTTLTVGLINNAGRLIDIFSKVSELGQEFSKWDPTSLHNIEKALNAVGINTSELLGTTQTSLIVFKKASDEVQVYGTAADMAAAHTRALTLAWDALDKALSDDQARIDAKNQIADIAKAIDKHSGSLDIDTQAGRNNRSALEGHIQALEHDRDALIKNGMSASDANKLFQGWIKSLEKSAHNAGVSKSAIQKLNEQLGLIPSSKTVKITVKVNGDGDYITSQGHKYNRWGGLYEHAATGALRDASVYSPAGPARYAFAEPQTGGEAFVPKRGNYGRSMGILDHAAGWYGARVVPAGGGGVQAPQRVDVHFTAAPGAASQLLEQLRAEIFLRTGGNVQKAMGR